ncbi:class I SAM-dependent RNA methyltransferase [Opitutus sp. ER46]|uniref:class I SAM-dependent RNA methyltransferase n=1 Tax=Opitutus sp. ER46 TaxID=2161864 RepID=UPI000D2FC9A9|nr:class I SAM-dependent RNA methyltransferase [Opitutus sp. ER46]PTX98489.1 SAM-dependent methyltransferase [Opitutus sp. ER46]
MFRGAVGRKKPFNDHPFAYHQEIELEITTLTNLGLGLGRVEIAPRAPAVGAMAATTTDVAAEAKGPSGWVVMVPFTLPGERVRARVFRNHKNYSEADLVNVLVPSPERVQPRCPLFGRCGGCQYQHLSYVAQLQWKQRQVAELLLHMADTSFPVSPVVSSPREYGYRSKITPHFAAPRRPAPAAHREDFGVTAADDDAGSEPLVAAPQGAAATGSAEGVKPFPIGFLRQGTRFDIVDVPHCPIATDAINARLGAVRAAVHGKAASYTRGATLLLREASGEVTTDYDAVITETIDRGGSEAPIRLHFLARDFFQNNPFILPAFTGYVRTQAAQSGARFLVDAYCGSGLFALTAASAFERVAGVEISESSVRFAKENAAANGITNASFLAADAAGIFAGLEFPAADTAVIIDPPRKGSDEAFLKQLFAFGPRAVVYVSCDPATQMRDLRHFLAAGYRLTAAQPFDLFPQTRHLECVLTLVKG